MAINLEKGQRIDLSKEAPGATKYIAGLGWDPRSSGDEFDLDASVLLLDADGKPFNGAKSLVYFGEQASKCGGVKSSGDNRSGEGDGDDEQLTIDLDVLDEKIQKMVVFVTIYDAAKRGQNFGMVDNAFIRIMKDGSDEPVAKYDLTEDYSTETTVVFGEFYKKDGSFRFAAKGEPFDGDMAAFLATYGL